MACPMPYTSISYVSALSKKNIKESNPWAQQQQSSQISSSSQSFASLTSGSCKPDDDGGWSMGTPEKGSGWSNVRSYGTNSESWSNLDTIETSSISGPEVATKSEMSSRVSSLEQNLNSCCNSWSFCKSSATSNHQRSAQTLIDDNEENRSQSPAGLTMITYKGENDTACVPQDLLGINDWGLSKSTPGKMPCSVHEKDNYPTCEWDNVELSLGENPPSFTVSNGSHALSKDQIVCQSELEASTLDPGSMGSRSRSGAGTPNSRSSGGATPTQETGGRTSAGSTSSVNSVGSSSSWKSDGKGSKSYVNRLGSPRKPSRYDRSNSQSGTPGVVNDMESNSHYKARKPKKTLPELEGGLGSLHSEPSGWGELPSPKPCDVDNGTELWGVPPADQDRYLNKAVSGDKKNVSLNGQEWKDEDSSGTVTAGWSKDNSNTVQTSRASTTPIGQWRAADEISWGSKVLDSVPSYSDNLKSISDVKSPQDDYHRPFVDSDVLESVDGGNNDKMLFHGKGKKLSKGNSPNGAYVYGNSNSKEMQVGSATNQAPHSSSSCSSVQNHLLFLKLLQGNGGQQVLTQRLGQLQLHKQQLLLQINQLSKSTGQSGSGINAVVHQQSQAIGHKLTTINQMISQLNQQMMVLSQLSSQPKEVGKNSETGSPSLKVIHNPPTPFHFKTDPKGTGSFGRSQSANAMVGIGVEPSRSLMCGVQGLCLSNPGQPSVSQSSARSMSRLQQIISGSCSTDSRDDMFQSNMPITSVAQNSSFASPGSLQPGNATSPFSSTQNESIAISADNRFFLGGASPAFAATKSVNDIQEFRPGVPWQPKSQGTEPTQMYSKQASVPTGNNYQQFGPQQLSGGSNAQLMRSQSVVDTCCNSAVSPQSKCNQSSGHLSHRIGLKAYTQSQHQPKPSTQSPEMFSVGPGWKLKGRTIAPPSSLYPSQDFQYKPGFSTKKHHRLAGPPQSTASQRNWSSTFASGTPGSSSSSMISHTVWGPDPGKVNNAEDSQLQGWSNGYGPKNHTWLDMNSNRNPASSYASPQPQSNTSSSETYSRNSVSSLTSSEGTWGQDELHSLSAKQGMVSPEPTFAEWQAGKKARLSVTKLPSNPPSPWLIIRNINSQVSEATLREIFNDYGTIQEWIVCPALECILLCYQSTDVSVPVKEHLNSNSDKLGVDIIVQFASKPDVDLIIERSCEDSPRSLFSESRLATTGAHLPGEDSSTTDWDGGDSNAPSSFGQQSSDSTTPGSSLWSDSGFLSGLSSPWHGSLTVPGSSVVNSNAASPHGNTVSEGSENCSNPSVSPFLPNDLL